MRAATKINRNNFDLEKTLANLKLLIIDPLSELIDGFKGKRLPIFLCLFCSSVIHISIIANIDHFLFRHIGLGSLYPKESAAMIYKFGFTLLPFWSWGIFQVVLRLKLIKALTTIFRDAGLKSITGRLPAFIFDKPLDEFSRRMRITKNGLNLSEFESAKDSLESSLQVYVDEICEDRRNGTVDIIYSHKQLSPTFEVKDFKNVHKGSFLLGKGRSKEIFGKLKDTPHLLVAGQTGMGKSTFLRQLITSLYLNNNYSFQLVDLKEGLEFQIFRDLPRVEVKDSVPAATRVLDKLANQTIKSRSEILKLNGCKDIDALHSIKKEDQRFLKSDSELSNFTRRIVVIDEAFDLFMVGPYADAKTVKASRRYASKIAAQGRAVGIHLVVATQRPDRFAIDPQTKANLTGKVCFRVNNLASSMTVMDCNRAAELPNIKGRAIWQNSNDLLEVQTPLFTEKMATSMLSSHYAEPETKIEHQTPTEQESNKEY